MAKEQYDWAKNDAGEIDKTSDGYEYYKSAHDSGQNRTNDGVNTASISTENYEVPGLEQDQMDLAYARDNLAGRRGVQADSSQANAALANALDSYSRQQQLGYGYQRAMEYGSEPSAAQLGSQMALDQAIAQQYAGGGSGANQYLAGNQGVGTMTGIGAQYGAARAQELAAAQQGAIGAHSGARGGMLTQMGQSQDFAYQQAQLDAAQMARNDEMARYYTGMSNQLNLDQLMAAQQYEAQKGQNMLKTRTARQAAEQAESDRDDRRTTGIVNGVLSAATLGIL